MIDDLRVLVDDLVRDVVGRVGDDARDRAIGLAVVQYAKDRPRTAVADLSAIVDGDPVVRRLPLPAGWGDDSDIVSIEHPIGHVPPRLLPRETWSRLQTPTGVVIALPRCTTAGDVHRMIFTVAHVLDDTTDTVPVADREAVAQYAAAILLDQVAALTSGDSGSTIKADAVDHGASGPNYAERARTARKRYHDLLGIDPKRMKAASVTVHPPLPTTTGQGRLLFRRPR